MDHPATDPGSPRPLPTTWPRVQLAGSVADLLSLDDAVALIVEHARGGHDHALGVVSLNLDHLHHFGSANATSAELRREVIDTSLERGVRWLALLDGAPLVRRANELTGRRWPRLAGSDLIGPVLDRAEAEGLSVAFLGGAATTHADLAPILARQHPGLRVAGFWAPERSELADPVRSAEIDAEIRAAEVDILVVCLGKPRQEQWIATHGLASGAKVHLAFGAVVDFLAGRVNRSPRWVADHGLEWAWRLAMEPRRLARRYLIQGPPAYWALQRDSWVKEATPHFAEPASAAIETAPAAPATDRFVGPQGHADVAVVVVTYNNSEDVDPLVASLRAQLADVSLRVVVADNSSTDDTVDRLRQHPDVIVLPTGGNLGYAGGINVARRRAGDADAVLVLNPDLALAPGAIAAMRTRLAQEGVGAVVPRLLEADGVLYPSLRHEPTLARALGDAVLGSRLGGRPAALSEIEQEPARYRAAHPVDWATGAAIMVDATLERQLGDWDEQFFLYSEEVDYARRLRELGAEVWFEPAATMEHRRGGSGASDQLEALMAVNRVRYHEKWHGRARTVPFRAAVVLSSLLRANQKRHRTALRYLVRRDRWDDLPAAVPPPEAGS